MKGFYDRYLNPRAASSSSARNSGFDGVGLVLGTYNFFPIS